MLRLFLLFTLLPIVELWLLLQIGSLLGGWKAFALVIGTGFLGAFLAKREGFRVLQELTQEMQRGIPPADRLIEGALVVIGGLLLVTPGVITDLTGFILIFPPTRMLLAPAIKRWVLANVKMAAVGPGGSFQASWGQSPFEGGAFRAGPLRSGPAPDAERGASRPDDSFPFDHPVR
jgi:UPF0716 protein FxsA